MGRYESDSNYYNDPRVRGRERANLIHHVDKSRKVAHITLLRDDEEQDVEVPVRYEVCPTCEGQGSHVNPSVDCDGLTAEDFAEDPDFAEDYVSGCYDVPCYECSGQRVIAVIDEDRCDKEILEKWRQQEKKRRGGGNDEQGTSE
jgi:hypothetical protein